MTRAELLRDLDAVHRHLVLLTAVVESLASGVRTPQGGPEPEAEHPLVRLYDVVATGKGSGVARRRTRARGDLPAVAQKRRDIGGGRRP